MLLPSFISFPRCQNSARGFYELLHNLSIFVINFDLVLVGLEFEINQTPPIPHLFVVGRRFQVLVVPFSHAQKPVQQSLILHINLSLPEFVILVRLELKLVDQRRLIHNKFTRYEVLSRFQILHFMNIIQRLLTAHLIVLFVLLRVKGVDFP